MSEHREGGGPPNEEREPRPKIAIMFRENNLYTPELKAQLGQMAQEAGLEAVTQTFPAGTSEKEIAEWLEANPTEASLLEGSRLMDGTIERVARGLGIKAGFYGGYGEKIDGIFSSAASKVINGEIGVVPVEFEIVNGVMSEREDNTLTDKEKEHRLVSSEQRLLEMLFRRGKPHMINIIKEKLGDHQKPLDIPKEERPFGQNDSVALEAIAQHWKRLIVEAGMVPDMVRTFETASELKTDQDELSREDWTLVDRHSAPYRKDNTLPDKWLRMPMESLVEDAWSQGLIDLEPAQIRGLATESLKEIIDDFAKKHLKKKE